MIEIVDVYQFFLDCMLIKMTVIVISLKLKSIINQTIFHNLCALNWNNPVHFRAKTFIRNSENVNLMECIREETPAICFCLVYILNEIKKRKECEARARALVCAWFVGKIFTLFIATSPTHKQCIYAKEVAKCLSLFFFAELIQRILMLFNSNMDVRSQTIYLMLHTFGMCTIYRTMCVGWIVFINIILWCISNKQCSNREDRISMNFAFSMIFIVNSITCSKSVRII